MGSVTGPVSLRHSFLPICLEFTWLLVCTSWRTGSEKEHVVVQCLKFQPLRLIMFWFCQQFSRRKSVNTIIRSKHLNGLRNASHRTFFLLYCLFTAAADVFCIPVLQPPPPPPSLAAPPQPTNLILMSEKGTVFHTWHYIEDVALAEFMYLVFTRMPGESYCRPLRFLLLCLCDVFRAIS